MKSQIEVLGPGCTDDIPNMELTLDEREFLAVAEGIVEIAFGKVNEQAHEIPQKVGVPSSYEGRLRYVSSFITDYAGNKIE